MQILIPCELNGKIDFDNNDVLVKKGVELTDEEEIIFDSFRKQFELGLKMRFDD